MAIKKTKKDGFDFGEAYKELEGIVAWFEADDVDLDAGLTKFERGLELARACRERLAEIENKVSEITERFEAPEHDAA